MQKLSNLVDELASYIPQSELRNDQVSASNVGWQIEHSLLVISSVLEGLKRSNPAEFKSSFRPLKYLILWRGIIPRGKVKAPSRVSPDSFTAETLQAHVTLCREKIAKIDQLDAGQYFTHPMFGDLKVKQAIPFLAIHTEHHVKIIRDMLG
jgi:hypothetical protein